MTWNQIALAFEKLAEDGDANIEWMFDPAKGAHHQWLLSDSQSSVCHRELWDLFSAAGALLPSNRSCYSMLPRKLLSQRACDWRWLAAIRHLKLNVVHLEPTDYRTDGGMIHAVAAASAGLCRRLGEAEEKQNRLADHFPDTSDLMASLFDPPLPEFAQGG